MIDAVGMEAHGSPTAEGAQKVLGLLPKKIQGAVMQYAVDRLAGLHTSFESVRRGGTVSISGVYGGAAVPIPLMQIFDKQLQRRMGQANVRRWSGDIVRLLETDRLGVEEFATHHLAARRGAGCLRHLQGHGGRDGEGRLHDLIGTGSDSCEELDPVR